jgi:hypothetical protein
MVGREDDGPLLRHALAAHELDAAEEDPQAKAEETGDRVSHAVRSPRHAA